MGGVEEDEGTPGGLAVEVKLLALFAVLFLLVAAGWLVAQRFLDRGFALPESAFVDENGTYISTYLAPDEALQWMESEQLIFNQPLPPDTPTVANSETIAGRIDAIVRGELLYDYASGFEDDANAPNFVLVDSDVEQFTEILFRPEECGADTWWNWSAAEFEPYINGVYADAGQTGVPLPADFKMSAVDEDFQVVVYDWRRDVLIELWRAKPTNLTGRPGIEVCWGGVIEDYAAGGSGIFSFPMGVSASGLAAPGLTITLEDVRRGEINHAIGVSAEIAVDNLDGLSHSYPANRSDGRCSDVRSADEAPIRTVTEAVGGEVNCLVEGQYLRLPSDFDVESISHPFARMVATAMRDYGLVLQDIAGCFCLQSESSSGLTVNGRFEHNLWEATYDGASEWEILSEIDWTQLQVLPRDWNKPAGHQTICTVPPNRSLDTNPLAADIRCEVPSGSYLSG